MRIIWISVLILIFITSYTFSKEVKNENSTLCSHGFLCNDSKCIEQSWVCDNDWDCQDGSDEAPERCAEKTCGEKEFKCKHSFRCIPEQWRCDTVPDCGNNDESDESDCPVKEKEADCDGIRCTNGECMPWRFASYCVKIDACRKHCSSPCNETQFACSRDLTCIPLSARCDGFVNCTDGSDEVDCDSPVKETETPIPVTFCESEEFSCRNITECIRKNFVCDGKKDCIDGTDEDNCDGKAVNLPSTGEPIPSFLCPFPSRLCDNNTTCVEIEKLCDGVAQCSDKSDEGGLCDKKLCGQQNSCNHVCHNTPQGSECLCPSGQRPNNNSECNICDVWGICSQLCHPHAFKSTPKCGCYEGYTLEPDMFSCRSNDPTPPLLLFTNRHELRSVDILSQNITAKALIFGLKNTMALDFYHGSTDLIFWVDVIEDKIFRGTLSGGVLSQIEVVVQTGLQTAEGMAVDWIGGNLYWVESNLDHIEISRLNGSFRRTLIAGDMESPRAICLDPLVGLVFWTDWDTNLPRIERSSMAGGNRKRVVELPQGAWPNGLTLDYLPQRIYWIDARLDSIHTARYDGLDSRVVITAHETLSHPFAITLYDNFLYWTDWRSNTVVRANKWNGTNVKGIQRTLIQPFDIKVFHPSRQPRGRKPHPCEKNNGGCSHLCLVDLQSYTCSCPHAMTLASDNKTCVDKDEQILIFSSAGEIRGVNLEMPYYHVLPTIRSILLAPSAVDFSAKDSRLYWTDPQSNEVKMARMQGGPSDTIIDAGIKQPLGIAIDWIANTLYITGSDIAGAYIYASNFQGERITVVYNESNGSYLSAITSLAVDPVEGKLYWTGLLTRPVGFGVIKSCRCDGSKSTILASSRESQLIGKPQSIAFDPNENVLYWVNADSKTIQTMSVNGGIPTTLVKTGFPYCLTRFGKYLYYSDHADGAIHRYPDGQVLRKKAGQVLAMRVFAPKLQNITSNACTKLPKCHHLCLPTSPTTRKCACATGYFPDPDNSTHCVGLSELLVFTNGIQVRTLDLTGKVKGVIGPLSRISMASHLSSFASQDYILWADSEQGRLDRAHPDGTSKHNLTERMEALNSPEDIIGGLAVDWVAGNVFWTDPKMNTIEVARLDGSSRYVVGSMGEGRIGAIAVDPIEGRMFWILNGAVSAIMTSLLDGSRGNVIMQSHHPFSLIDIALDSKNKMVYWCGNESVGVVPYNGTNKGVILDEIDWPPKIPSPKAMVVHNETLYWIAQNSSTIFAAPLNNLSSVTKLVEDGGVHLKDLDIFSVSRENGSNPCRNNSCQGLCLFNGTHAKCVCSNGQVGPDGFSCVAYNDFIMYSRTHRIDSIHLNDTYNLNSPVRPLENHELMRNVVGLAYDYRKSLIFYSDIQRGTINSVHINGTNHTVLVDSQGSVEGLAFNTYDNYLYWTCNNHATISRLSFKTGKPINNSAVEVVVRLPRDDKPRGIAVNPCHGQLFWANWNTQSPSIQRSYLNGYDVQSIVKTNIKMPNAIALDFQTMRLYWCDARLDKIEHCDLDGKNRVVLTGGIPKHPFGVAIYGNFLYWTDWALEAVVRVNKYNGQELKFVRTKVRRTMGIIAVHKDPYKCTGDSCKWLNGGCEDVCTASAFGGAICSCKSGRIADPKDPTRCINSTQLANDTNLFQCSSGILIPFSLTCDTIPHCDDGTDEDKSYCASRMCLATHHRCPNGRCIDASSVCDGHNDCGDKSDEFNCPCDPETNFECDDGECIPKSFRCDRDPDCQDVSDEKKCPAVNCLDMSKAISEGSIIPQMINCNFTTACIHPRWICDGLNDCWDNSDEANCPEHHGTQFSNSSCSSEQFTCRDGGCIPITWECDHQADCDDSSDELHCTYESCMEDQFRCKSGECFPKNWACDTMPDCADGSDEENCDNTICEKKFFRCNSTGRCIPLAWICDGENDCKDGSDEPPEKSCAPFNDSCLDSDFTCQNGHCISMMHYCDGINHCHDGSDEPSSCEKLPRCASDQFECELGSCIPNAKVCDGHLDCRDGSDETIHNCRIGSGECRNSSDFRCANSICIGEELVCDGNNDCGDFSDEKTCDPTACLRGNPCAPNQVCISHRYGYSCKCEAGLKPGDKTPCVDIDECQNPDVCSHFCWNTYGSFQCYCPSNYTLRSDRRSCKANTAITPRLVFANRYYIREVDLHTNKSSLLFHNLTQAIAIDFDWKDKCLYWTDQLSFKSTIKRHCSKNITENNGTVSISGEFEVVFEQAESEFDGLAVDWVGRNLYWCDKKSKTIEVSNLEGQYRKVLIRSHLSKPRAITLNPADGTMYWTDWGTKSYIGKASMDGSNFRVIVNSTLSWPNALAICYETKQLYFADARLDYIAVSDLEGQNIRRLISRNPDKLISPQHIFALTVFEDSIIWTDWELKSIIRCYRLLKTDCEVLVNLTHRPMDLKVYHPLRQLIPEVNPCENNGNCSALCLLSENKKHVCACPEDFKLDQDGRTCIANCTGNQYVCPKTLKCINFWQKCDTHNDCGDGWDEPPNCTPFHCLPGQFQCDNNTCLHPSQICDGVHDCNDQQDEMDCSTFVCLKSHFKCPANDSVPARCISETKRCDGIQNCPGGEDEQDCKVCDHNSFRCKGGHCIPASWVCDESPDCPKKDDEGSFCANRTCPMGHIPCKGGQCILESWKCDNEKDCVHGDDEPPSCADDDYHKCDPTYFKCANSKCIPGRWRCDNAEDCDDGSDERNCTYRNCSESEYRCASGQCIPARAVCDGYNHCGDHSDELNCTAHCTPDQFECTKPKRCIPSDWECDGELDCPDGSDERHSCNVECPPGLFSCHNKQCIEKTFVCDGEADCLDGSDEIRSVCSQYGCTKYSCNGTCVPKARLCDGISDCQDGINGSAGSDESSEVCRAHDRCAVHEFQCRDRVCISKQLVCDGFENCGDGSDESDCDKQQFMNCFNAKNCSSSTECFLGLCSQECIQRKNDFLCHCAPGYLLASHSDKPTSKSNKRARPDGFTCSAPGEEPMLILATDAEVHLLSMYSARDFKNINLGNGMKTAHSVDFYYTKFNTTIFLLDASRKKLSSLTVANGELMSPRKKRSLDELLQNENEVHNRNRQRSLDELLQNENEVHNRNRQVRNIKGAEKSKILDVALTDPRALAIDWIAKRLYVIDVSAIAVMTFEGKKKTTILEPFGYLADLAIHPESASLVFADRGPTHPLIGKCRLDGSMMDLLVYRNLIWPVGVAIDGPTQRVYFTDAKRRVIESINLDGQKRMLVADLDRHGPMPWRLDIFEDTITVSLYQGSDILRIDKHGSPTGVHSLQRFTTRISSLAVMHSVRQSSSIRNPCANPQACHSSALCIIADEEDGVLTSKCVCPDGTFSPKERKEVICQKKCELLCFNGKCVNTANGPKCKCDPMFHGELCDQYICEGRCLNKGICSAIPVNNTIETRCHCHRDYTGERCETKLECSIKCLNRGVCRIDRCVCPPGFTGTRCKDCIDLACHNGGICSTSDSGKSECLCARGFRGRQCENSVCDGYCAKGNCTVENDAPRCHCPPNRTGIKCDREVCTGNCGGLPDPCSNVFCQNGGTCNNATNPPTCRCPTGFTGSLCDTAFDLSESSGSTGMESLNIAAVIMISICVILIIWIAVAAAYFIVTRCRRTNSFRHVRMTENTQMNNPMYMQGEEMDQVTLNGPILNDPIDSNNFANPVYESVYNGDEKKNLLSSAMEDPSLGSSMENDSSIGFE